MEKEKLNLLISIDDKYIKQVKNLIYSIILNNDVYLNVFLIYGQDLSQNSIKDISDFLENNEYGKLNPIYFESKIELPNFVKYISVTSNYRLFAPYMIQEKIDRLLYLDCDIICNGSIIEFYNSDFEGNAIIACKNIIPDSKKEFETFMNIKLGLTPDYQYINSGVLLINIPEYVKNITMNELYDFIDINRENLMFADQDTINSLFYNKIKLADKIYNFQINFIDNDSAYENARLVHYSGKQKPWNLDYIKPKKGIIYYEFLKKSNKLDELKELISEQYKNMALKFYESIVYEKSTKDENK